MKCDPYIALLHIRMNPLGLGLPSLGTMLFNCPIRGIMPIISRPPTGEDYYEVLVLVLVNRQTKNDKNQGTPRNYDSILTGFTVAVKCGDGTLWIHGTIEGKGDHNHHERSYNICITKKGPLITTDRKHIMPTHK